MVPVVATAIIRRDGKYLIAQRSPDEQAFASRWTVPGGTFERQDLSSLYESSDGHLYGPMESLVRREVREEVGLEVGSLRWITSLCYYKGEQLRLCLSFCASYESGSVALNEEYERYAWVSSRESLAYDMPAGLHEQLFMADDVFCGREVKEFSAYVRQVGSEE